MVTNYENYMIVLAEEGVMKKAAAKLGISQPALSKWLSSEEKDLGSSLFIRGKPKMTLTPAGEIYLNYCRQVIQIKNQTFAAISRRSDTNYERIRYGATIIRGAKTFANLYRDFKRRFPNVSLEFYEEYSVPKTKQDVKEGIINLGLFSTFDTSPTDVKFITVQREEFVLMLPPGHPLSYDNTGIGPNDMLPLIDIRKIEDTPFLLTMTSQHDAILQLLRDAGLEANISFKTPIMPLLYDMVLNGCGATIISRNYLKPNGPICAYSFYPRLYNYCGLIFRNDHNLSEAERYLVRLTTQYYGSPVYFR